MLDPVKAWHEEHMYFNRLLRLLRKEIDVFHGGDTPNYQLMLDIIAYLREYADQYHHPREDEAFRRLTALRPDRQLPLARLMQEHRVISRAGDQLAHLLEEIDAGSIIQRAEIEMAAATFLVYYGNHIAKEEEDILPLAGQLLQEPDWIAVKNAAIAGNDPLFGAEPLERFRDLRRRIEAEAD
jgi:hemerythrin-like domain-containing protein